MEAQPNRDYRLLSKAEVLLGIPEELCPMVVLSENFQSFVSRRIVFWSTLRQHEKHQYSHAMELYTTKTLATQGLFYREEPLADWAVDWIRLKFWHCLSWTPQDRKAVLRAIEADLVKPWYRRIYDLPGVGGQWLESITGVGACLNVPGIHFCSPRTASHIRPWTPGLKKQPSPAQIDEYLENRPEWAVYGVYDPREERGV